MSSNLNASGMRWVSELSNHNFSIKYRLGKVSIYCDYLYCTPVKSFESHTEETDFHSVSTIISALSTSRDNWITVLQSTPNSLGNFNFGNDNTPDTVNLEELKNEQNNDSAIKPIYHAAVSDRKPLNSERTKFGKTNKSNIKLLEQIRVKSKWNFS